jgi:hypothetical protein
MSAGADTFANTFPLHVPTRVRRGPRPFFRPFPSTFLAFGLQNFMHSLASTHTPLLLPHAHTRCCLPSCAAWTAATSSCRTVGWRVLPRPHLTPHATSPSQLEVQQPRRGGQEGRQRRRWQRRQHHLLASGRGAPRHHLVYPHQTCSTRPRRPPPPRPRPQTATQPMPRPPPRPHSTACPPRSLNNRLQHRGHLAHMLARLARRRAAQRWSALVSAPGSRLARQMRPHLGMELWDEFVEHVNRHYKAGLAARVCACIGRAALRGHPRRRAVHARGAVLDLRAGTGTGEWGGSARSVRPSSGCTWITRGRCMLRVTGAWRAAMRAAPRSWDDGLDGAALCHDLFGVCAVSVEAPGRHQARQRSRDRRARAPGRSSWHVDQVIFEDQWCCRCGEAVRESHGSKRCGVCSKLLRKAVTKLMSRVTVPPLRLESSVNTASPVLAVLLETKLAPKEEPLLLTGSRATRRCKCSSRLLGARTSPKCSPFCQRPIDTPDLSPSPLCSSLTVWGTTRLETRAPPRSPPSSRRRSSPTWGARRPPSVCFCVNAH